MRKPYDTTTFSRPPLRTLNMYNYVLNDLLHWGWPWNQNCTYTFMGLLTPTRMTYYTEADTEPYDTTTFSWPSLRTLNMRLTLKPYDTTTFSRPSLHTLNMRLTLKPYDTTTFSWPSLRTLNMYLANQSTWTCVLPRYSLLWFAVTWMCKCTLIKN